MESARRERSQASPFFTHAHRPKAALRLGRQVHLPGPSQCPCQPCGCPEPPGGAAWSLASLADVRPRKGSCPRAETPLKKNPGQL